MNSTRHSISLSIAAIFCAAPLLAFISLAHADPVTFTTLRSGDWRNNNGIGQPATRSASPDHIFPVAGDTANVSFSFAMAENNAVLSLGLSAGGLQLAGGTTLAITGPSQWSAAAITGAGASVNFSGLAWVLSGGANKTLLNLTLNNTGTFQQQSTGNVDLGSGTTVFNNLAAGVYDFQSDAD
jgi:hypothetical protein